MLAPRGAPSTLVRVVAAGGRGRREFLRDLEEDTELPDKPWHHVFISFILRKTMMEMLQRRQWKLHMRHGDLLSDGINEDMIVRIGKHMSEILIEYEDEPDDFAAAAGTTDQVVSAGLSFPHVREPLPTAAVSHLLAFAVAGDATDRWLYDSARHVCHGWRVAAREALLLSEQLRRVTRDDRLRARRWRDEYWPDDEFWASLM